jgi:predicted cupin superfamily sugar epimerase
MQAIDFIEHPEGGRYREVFKSQRVVTNLDDKQRSALTHIYFELKRLI